MKRLVHTVLAAVRLLGFSALALAAPSLLEAGGPTYSRYGIGDRYFFGSGRSYGMGLTGIALAGPGFVNRWNPATLAATRSVLFEGSLEASQLIATDPYGSSKYLRGEFQSLALAIPIAPAQGITLAFDITPYSKTRYGVVKDDLNSPYPSSQTLTGTGSVTALSASASVAVTDDFLVGFRLSHLFGRIEEVLSVEFVDPGFVDSDTYVNRHHNGNMVTGSFAFSGFQSMLGIDGLKDLTLGLIVSSPSRLNVRADREYFSTYLSDTTLKDNGTTKLPWSYGLGISYVMNNRYVVSGEVISELGSEASYYDAPPAQMRNSLRAALGFEALASRELGTFWSQVSYSVGAAYHASSLVLDGNGLDEIFGAAGVGFPLAGNSRIRLALQGGVRGTGSDAFARESFFRLSVTLSVGEEWITRIDED